MIAKIIKQIQAFNASRELRTYVKKINASIQTSSVKEVLSVIFDEPFKRFFWIKQVREEFTQLCHVVHDHKPATVLEIGTANGGSLFAFAKLSSPEASIFSIDLPGGEFGGGYPAYRAAFYKNFRQPGQQIELMRCDSHHSDTLNTLKEMLGGRSLDFLFIDGDHTYEGVKTDFQLYAPLVRKGGLIAFHDIAKHPEAWNVHVDRLWNEVKEKFDSVEFIHDKNQGWAGIGLIRNFDPDKL
ncbi:MAG TPA: class I SAM-dependent methyltransferase [Ohtaekwangia sp.]